MPTATRPIHERPCAVKGLKSFRFTTSQGTHVMIGARDRRDAISEARRSTQAQGTLYVWEAGHGYIWDGHYAAKSRKRYSSLKQASTNS